MCLECCSPAFALGATYGNSLIIVLSVGRTGEDDLPQLFTPFSSFRFVTTACENFEFPLDVKEGAYSCCYVYSVCV